MNKSRSGFLKFIFWGVAGAAAGWLASKGIDTPEYFSNIAPWEMSESAARAEFEIVSSLVGGLTGMLAYGVKEMQDFMRGSDKYEPS